MDRTRALNELNARLENKNLIKHSLAVEAIMMELAVHMNDRPDLWGLAGLLHDIDYEKTANNPEMHGVIGSEILENLSVDPEIIYAVKAHNPATQFERKRKIDKALYCSDPVSGLITAGALILPSKKLKDVTVEFLMKRFNEKSFAKGANREQIMKCEELNLTLERFLEIALTSMQKISGNLGL
jgi:uncharacterized domain HDIG